MFKLMKRKAFWCWVNVKMVQIGLEHILLHVRPRWIEHEHVSFHWSCWGLCRVGWCFGAGRGRCRAGAAPSWLGVLAACGSLLRSCWLAFYSGAGQTRLVLVPLESCGVFWLCLAFLEKSGSISRCSHIFHPQISMVFTHIYTFHPHVIQFTFKLKIYICISSPTLPQRASWKTIDSIQKVAGEFWHCWLS